MFSSGTSQHDEIYKLLDNVIKSRAGSTSQPPPPPRPTDLPIPTSPTHDDSYDHLMSSPLKGITPAHPIHPNYDQNPISTMSQRSTKGQINDYASPYGHMRNRESLSAARDFEVATGEGYDTLHHQRDSKEFLAEGYDVLNPNKPTRVAPPLPSEQCTEDVYNTIDSGVTGNRDGGYDKDQHASGSSPADDTYDSLDYKQGSTNKRYTYTSPECTLQDSGEGDTYNMLAHVASPVTSPMTSPGPQNTGSDDYSTLDRPHAPLRQSKSFPIPPPRVPSTTGMPQGYNRSSISSVSSFGSFDHSGSFRDSRLSSTSSPIDDQDFYSSIDNDTTNKKSQNKVSNAEEEKNKQSLVSSLRASLIADGLNLNKINQGNISGRRRCSVDIIEESDMYDKIDEGDRKSVVNRSARSPSAPVEHVEDIYEDPDNQSHRASTKPKISGPKPVKPRKKK